MFGTFFLILLVQLPAEETDPFVIEMGASCGEHDVTITIELSKFDPSKHEISYRYMMPVIDGQPALGFQPGFSKAEFEKEILPGRERIISFVVDWNGKNVTLPGELFLDCFNPIGPCDSVRSGKKVNSHFQVEFGHELKTLFVFLSAVSHYEVLWVIGRDGHHTRLVNPHCDSSVFWEFVRWKRNGLLCDEHGVNP